MKNGDIFYTFDTRQGLVKKVVVVEERRNGCETLCVEITGTTTCANYDINNSHLFPTPELALFALQKVLERQHEWNMKSVEERFKETYQWANVKGPESEEGANA